MWFLCPGDLAVGAPTGTAGVLDLSHHATIVVITTIDPDPAAEAATQSPGLPLDDEVVVVEAAVLGNARILEPAAEATPVIDEKKGRGHFVCS
jgi:hypothetical protein